MIDDYDLEQCLENNPQAFTIQDVEEILAVYEGVNDEENWIWVLRRKAEALPHHNSASIIWLEAGCDYTGWDCHSWVTEISYYHKPSNIEDRLHNVLTSRLSLLSQLSKGKAETWREKMDKEFGINSSQDTIKD